MNSCKAALEWSGKVRGVKDGSELFIDFSVMPLVRPQREGRWYLGEDYAFCERARQAGYKILADITIRLWHVGNFQYGWEDGGRDVQRFDDYTFHFGGDWNLACDTAVRSAGRRHLFANGLDCHCLVRVLVNQN